MDSYRNKLIALNLKDPLGGLEIFTAERIYSLRTVAALPPKFQQKLLNECLAACRDCLGDTYLAKSLDKSLDPTKKEFDIALFVEHDTKKPIHLDPTGEHLVNFHVIGFILVYVGECKLPFTKNTAVIHAICARDTASGYTSGGTGSGGYRGVGKFAMALYLCGILDNSLLLNQEGMLELLNGYENTPGLCMYQKFGFQADFSLLDKSCFPSAALLPMRVDLNGDAFRGLTRDQKKELIVNIALSKRQIGVKHRICSTPPGQQLVLGFLNQYLILVRRDNPSFLKSRDDIAKEMATSTHLDIQHFEKLRSFLMQGRGQPWTDYFTDLAKWLLNRLVPCGHKHTKDPPDIVMPPELLRQVEVEVEVEDEIEDPDFLGLLPDPTVPTRSAVYESLIKNKNKDKNKNKIENKIENININKDLVVEPGSAFGFNYLPRPPCLEGQCTIMGGRQKKKKNLNLKLKKTKRKKRRRVKKTARKKN